MLAAGILDVIFGCIYNLDREKNIAYLKGSIDFMDDRTPEGFRKFQRKGFLRNFFRGKIPEYPGAIAPREPRPYTGGTEKPSGKTEQSGGKDRTGQNRHYRRRQQLHTRADEGLHQAL